MDFYRCANDFGREISISQLQILNRKVHKEDRKVREDDPARTVLGFFAFFAAFFAYLAVERVTKLAADKSSSYNLEPSLQHNPDRLAVRDMLLLQNARS